MNLLLLSTLVDFATGAVVLFGSLRGGARDERPAITMRRVAAAALATGLVFALKFALLGMAARGFFWLVHLVYVDLVVVVPALALLVVTSGLLPAGLPASRRLTPAVRVTAAACLLAAPVGVYASFIEPFRLQLEEVPITLPGARTGSSPVRVGVLADIQTDRVTDYERGAVDLLMALEPDIIVLPGDLFQGSRSRFERELPALRDLVGRLSAPGGVYFVAGNTDRDVTELREVFDGSRVRVLSNDSVSVNVGDRSITLTGLGDELGLPAWKDAIRALETAPGNGDVRILVGHYPDAVLYLAPRSRIDLVIGGHTHGGQVQLPFFGPLVTLSDVPRSVAAGGLHDLDGRRVYVSRGIGCERGHAPRIRFLCPPEVTLLTFR